MRVRHLLTAIVLCGLAAMLSACKTGGSSTDYKPLMSSEFGKMADGKTVQVFTLDNGTMNVKISNLGGTVTEINVPDRAGKLANVVLGFPSAEGYLSKENPYFGCITGRVCNRISGAKFKLGDKEYKLAANTADGNHLHGGLVGFNKRVWEATPFQAQQGPALKLEYTSPDGEEGYPGNLIVTVTYVLTKNNELRIDYSATTDKATPINLTNHSYFNLNGEASGKVVLNHLLKIEGENYTPLSEKLVPTGEIKPVKDTPFDFTAEKPLGQDIDKTGGNPSGYDLCYVIRQKEGRAIQLAAVLTEPESGRRVETWTTEPGVQLYTGNFLDGKITGTGGVAYVKNYGVCLETQKFADAVNQPKFPSTILEPGQTYSTVTVYRFQTVK